MEGSGGYNDKEHHSRDDASYNSTSVAVERSALRRTIAPGWNN